VVNFEWDVSVTSPDNSTQGGFQVADFSPAFKKMITNEGGYVLHKVQGDRGGLTYAGIAENFHPTWAGWPIVKQDSDDPSLTSLVEDFYKEHYWDKVKGDDLTEQAMAESIFDFAVNSGVRTSSKLAQLCVDASPDGKIGKLTVAKLNKAEEPLFISNFALAKIARYANIVKRNSSQKKFLLGWINRTLEGLK
jgi:lysozyme family protein